MPVRSVEKSERSRILPQYSFRYAMLGVTSAVGLAWLARMSYQGSQWATSLLVPCAVVVIYFVVSFLLFVLAWVPAVILRDKNEDLREGNPFAADQLPPQILPPKGH